MLLGNVFVFDIETVPDITGGRKLYGLPDTLSDEAVGQCLFAKRRAKVGSDFLPHHLHRIVAISAVFRTQSKITVWSLGEPQSSEADLIERFFSAFEKYSPTIVTWNGGGFDLPVLHYRALLHGIQAERYWEMGDGDRDFKWNNYISRFHFRHMDLMDILAGYQMRANAPLDEIATLLGFPGKMGMDGSKVWPAFQRGDIGAIRDYCETDVLNTYLVYLQFEFMRGRLDGEKLKKEQTRLKTMLESSEAPHLTQFLETWQNG